MCVGPGESLGGGGQTPPRFERSDRGTTTEQWSSLHPLKELNPFASQPACWGPGDTR